MEVITSSHNPRLKELRKLRDRKHRDRAGLFIAEGEDMLAEALRHGAQPQEVFFDADRVEAGSDALAQLPAGVPRIPVAGDALAASGSLGHGARVIGLWRQRWPEPDLERLETAVYLHEVSDPGNVGAVIRSAFALGSRSLVVLGPHAADPFAPKAVRASMGAIFGQALARASFEELRRALPGPWRSIALVPGVGTPLPGLALDPPVLWALGSERAGLPEDVARACDATAHVPLAAAGAESLNVAMAATVCLYEMAVHRLRR
jgi:TrmH family RNA methyltransferase